MQFVASEIEKKSLTFFSMNGMGCETWVKMSIFNESLRQGLSLNVVSINLTFSWCAYIIVFCLRFIKFRGN